MSNLAHFGRFVRTTWLAAALVIASTLILTLLGYAGDIALFAWYEDQRGRPLPPLSEWLAANYGLNEWNLVENHFCFCWAFGVLFVVSTFAPLSKFRRRFFPIFVLGWSLIVTFWAFLAVCASLSYFYAMRILTRHGVMIPKIIEALLWGLPVLFVALLLWRLKRLLGDRRA